MKNLSSDKIVRLIIAISCVVIGLSGVLIPYFFKEQMGNFWNYFLTILGAVCIFVSLLMFYAVLKKDGNKMNVRQMSMVGIMSAITVILYYFVKFNLPIFPPWLDIQVSELPALITGFAYGPFAGCLVIIVRFFIKLPGTITAGVGELADLVLSISVVLVSSIIYKKHKTIKGALVATGIGVGVGVVVSCFLNWLVLIPAYIYLAGFPLDALVGMLSYMPFEVTRENFMLAYVLVVALPFNLVRFILVYALTFLLYKRTHKLLKRITQ